MASRARYQKNKEKLNKQSHEYYLSHKKQYQEQSREYYRNNKERISKRQRKYRQTHRGKEAKRQRKYQQTHKEELVEKKREYYKTHKEQVAEYQQKYYQAHKEEKAEKQCKYYQSHKKKMAEKHRKYRSSPKGHLKIIFHNRKRKAHLKNSKATLTSEQWEKILKMQKNKCNTCGKRFTRAREPTMDHIIPLSQGGGSTSENIQALCRSCNSHKHAKIDLRFIQSWCCVEA